MTSVTARRAAAPEEPGAAALDVLLPPLTTAGSARCSPRRSGGCSSSTSGRSFLLLLASFWRHGGVHGTEIVHTWNLDNFRTLFEEPVYRNVAVADDQHGRARHDRRRGARVPDRVLHGAGRVAADAEPPRRRGAHAAVGELPRQGVLVADDARRGGRHQLAARAVRALQARATRRRASGSRSRTSGCRS